MSLKGLTANFNRSFEWFNSHRKRPVILSVVRAVAQLTKVRLISRMYVFKLITAAILISDEPIPNYSDQLTAPLKGERSLHQIL